MTTELSLNHRALEARKQILLKDLKDVVSDADDLVREVGNSTAEEFSAARAKIEARLADVRSRLHDARTLAARKACAAAEATGEYVRDNPAKVIGVALLAGLLAALLLSRR